jgi:Nitrate and nitrite sensing
MPLGREDATRIVRFCLAGVGWGSALHEDDVCVLKVGRSDITGTEIQRYEAATFEEALRLAAAAGTLKSSCLEKQIAFLARTLPERNAAPVEGTWPPAPRQSDPTEPLFAAVTTAISALVHETQRERGTSSLYLSSNGSLFGQELRGQWRITDQRRTELALVRERYAVGLPDPLARRLERAEGMLAKLCAARGQIESLDATAAQVIDRYSNANAELLSVIDGLAAQGPGGDTLAPPTALAWMALLYAKEKTGIERAQLASVFSRDRYAEGQHAVVSALIAACDIYLHMFSVAAPQATGEMLRAKLRTDVAHAVTEMELVALSRRQGGFGIDPTAWFANVSRKMDLFDDVESAVRASITRVAV